MRQSWTSGSNSYVADYIYTEAGTPLAFALSTNSGDYVYYFYETNIQGDVIAIYNSSWTKLAAFYYDAWGNFTPTIHNSTVYTSNFQKAILFRYRGYIYDTETQLYYLQTRYYDPAVGRFINADSYINANSGLIGYNMYAYCNNNPVMFVDPTGEVALETAAGGFLAKALSAVLAAIPVAGAVLVVAVVATVLVVTIVTLIDNVNHNNETTDTDDLSGIAGQYGNFECVNAAKAMENYLKKNKLNGYIISIQYPVYPGYVWSETKQAVISENGFHTGVYYKGKVYCNIHPYGLTEEEWLADFWGVCDPVVHKTPF